MAYSAPEPAEKPTATEPVANGTSEHRPAPLLAVLGAGDAAVTAVARAFADAVAAASTRRETVQHRVAELPAELENLRSRFSGDELRHAMETYREQVEQAYAQFVGRGEETWGKLREQPPVRQAITTLSSTGDKVAKAGQRFSGRAADTVVDVSAATAGAVEEAGTAAAEVIEDAGDDAASATRKATGSSTGSSTGSARATGRTAAPRRTTPKPSE